MTSRDWFWFLAGVLVTVAITVALRPWLRERPAQPAQSTIPAFALPVAAALALIGVALGIYFLIGSPDSIASAHSDATAHESAGAVTDAAAAPQMSGQSTNAGSLDDVTRKLANRLATQGGSDGEWQLLAESYDYMGKAAEAKAARAHIGTAGSPASARSAGTAGGDNPGSTSGNGSFDSQTLAAVADAFDSGSNSKSAKAVAVPSGSSVSPASAAAPGSPTDAPAEISGTVDIASKLASRAGSSATLFIYAKQPNAPGPPVAVVRVHADHWPVTFTLTDANAMVPGRNLSNAQTVQIEARISRNGDALPQSGDLVGSVTSVSPRGGRPVKISIDREIG
jgi:cytochrome c-type biogenesis protein CcmH